jgi:hypothetical protein
MEAYKVVRRRGFQSVDNRLTDGENVSLTRRPRSTPQKTFRFCSCTHFCSRLSKLQGLVRLEGLGQLQNTMILSSIETAISQLVMPQPSAMPGEMENIKQNFKHEVR